MVALQSVSLGMEFREAVVKYIEVRRTKALSTRSKLVSLRFRSSLFNIFFEPRLSDFQVKLYRTFQAMSVELQLDGLKVCVVLQLLGHVCILTILNSMA